VLLFVGDDWAEDHHDVELMDSGGRRLAKARLPEGVAGVARLHALIGAQVGYVIGRRGGKAMLARIRRKRIHEGVDRAAVMLEKYGYGKAIVLAR